MTNWKINLHEGQAEFTYFREGGQWVPLKATHQSWRSRIGWRSLPRVSRNLTQTWWRVGFQTRRRETGRFSHSTFPPAGRSRRLRPAPPHSRTWVTQKQRKNKASQPEHKSVHSRTGELRGHVVHSCTWRKCEPYVESISTTSTLHLQVRICFNVQEDPVDAMPGFSGIGVLRKKTAVFLKKKCHFKEDKWE